MSWVVTFYVYLAGIITGCWIADYAQRWWVRYQRACELRTRLERSVWLPTLDRVCREDGAAEVELVANVSESARN